VASGDGVGAGLQWLRDNYPEKAAALLAELQLDEEELAQWREVAERITMLYDEESGLFTQFEGFFELEPVDWPAFAERTQSLQVLLGIEGANESQVIKQPDVLMMLLLLRDHYTDPARLAGELGDVRADFRPRIRLVTGPSFHAWAACHMGEAERAYDFFMLAARADLQNVRGNAGDGIHAASAGGLWQALAFGFAGLRLTDDGYETNPCLPPHWERLAFSTFTFAANDNKSISSRKGGDRRSFNSTGLVFWIMLNTRK
jgi:trehalose/maltose hydrolase-like predicted phosphorylase